MRPSTSDGALTPVCVPLSIGTSLEGVQATQSHPFKNIKLKNLKTFKREAGQIQPAFLMDKGSFTSQK